MDKLDYNIIAEIIFFTTENGGRETETPGDFLACPMEIGGKKYDCRLLFRDTGPLKPGDKAILPIKFLDFNTVSNVIDINHSFKLWSIGVFAEGKIIKIAK